MISSCFFSRQDRVEASVTGPPSRGTWTALSETSVRDEESPGHPSKYQPLFPGLSYVKLPVLRSGHFPTGFLDLISPRLFHISQIFRIFCQNISSFNS